MQFEVPPSGLPAYTVRVSPRARHVRLKVSADEGLEVVVPKGFDQRRIPEILTKRRGWLEKHFTRIRAHQKLRQAVPKDVLPEVILLNAIGGRWAVEYLSTSATHVGAYEEEGNRLVLKGNIDDRAACRSALRRWLSRKAHRHLVPGLDRLSEQTTLPFNRVMVKGQKTRWASCSQRKNISINYKLLFLPERLVGYVFRHELCHTLVMNHSRRYWETLRRLEPDYKRLHEQTREAWKHLPAWVEQN